MPAAQLFPRDLRPMHLADIGCARSSYTPSTLCYVSSSKQACERVESDSAFREVSSRAATHGNVVTIARFCDNKPVSEDVLAYLRALPDQTAFSKQIQIASPETLGLLRVATIDVTGLQLDLDMKRATIETHQQAREAAENLRGVLVRLADFSSAPEWNKKIGAAQDAVRSEVATINEMLRGVQTLPDRAFYVEQGGGAQSDLEEMTRTIATSTKMVARLSLMKLAWVAVAEEVEAWTEDLLERSLGEKHKEHFANMVEKVAGGTLVENAGDQTDSETASEYLKCIDAVQKYTSDTLLPYLRAALPVAYVDPPPAYKNYKHWETARTTLLGCDAPEGSTVFAADGALGGGAGQPGSFTRLVDQVEKAVSVDDLTPQGKELLFAALNARSKRAGMLPRAGQLYDAPKNANLARPGVAVCTDDCPFAFFAPRALHSQAWMRWALLPRKGAAFVVSSNCGRTRGVVHNLAKPTREAARASRDVVFGDKKQDVADIMEQVTLATAGALQTLMPGRSLDDTQVLLGPVILRSYGPGGTNTGVRFPEHAARLMCAFKGDGTMPVACFAFPEVEVQRMLEQHGERDAPSAVQAPLTPQLSLHGRVRVPPLAAGRPAQWVDSGNAPSDYSVARYCSVYGEDTMCGVRCRLLPSQARLGGNEDADAQYSLTATTESVAGEGLVPLGAHWQTPPVFVLQQLH